MKRRLTLIPILVLGGLAAIAARQAASDVATNVAALEFESWSRPGYVRRPEVLPEVVSWLERALRISGSNAWALEYLGSMQFETMRGVTDPEMAVAAARASLESFRRVVRLRPTSPSGWINLAVAKQSLDEIDGEFFGALENSARYGPWEPPVLLLGLKAGLGAWDRATPAQRETILQIRDRAVQRDVGAVNTIARDYSRPELACDPKTAISPSGRPCPKPRT